MGIEDGMHFRKGGHGRLGSRRVWWVNFFVRYLKMEGGEEDVYMYHNYFSIGPPNVKLSLFLSIFSFRWIVCPFPIH